MHTRTIMLRRYRLAPGTVDEFMGWWTSSIPQLRAESGFTVDAAYVDREAETFTWVLSYPGDRAAFDAADALYSARPERAAAIAVAPLLIDVSVEFPERVL